MKHATKEKNVTYSQPNVELINFANYNHYKKIKKNWKTSSVYDCTVEDVEYIYNKLSI